MRIFIVGGSGFIGGHTARALIAAGHKVSSLARSAAAVAKLESLGVTPIPGDTDDRDAMARGLDAADASMFAAMLGEAENDVVGWMIDRMAGTGKSLVFCSGTGVFGERTAGGWSENTFAEGDAFPPSRALGKRIELEQEIFAASSRGLARGVVVRPPAVWSDEQPHLIVTGVLESVRRTGAACHVGAGLNMYSHVHVEDLAQVFRHAVERGRDGADYHAVAGEVPNRWIAEMVARIAGVSVRSVTMDEAIQIWGKFAALIVFGVSSRARSPRSRTEFAWAPEHTDMLAAAEVSVRQTLAERPLA